MSKTNWKKPLKIVLKIIIIVVIILSIAVVSAGGTVMFVRWHRDVQEKESGDRNFFENLIVKEKEKEPVVTCLFLGVNGSLTDFIMLGQYDPNTREIDLLSIPRDSNVGNNSVDGKINSAKYSKGLDSLKNTITEITGIKIDYYISFKTKILRQLVDEIGGVTVDVPINMNYDDPYQNLHIHLNKGTQKLTGAQAEQFCRFRKNNNGTGYAGGDVERTKTQQKFIMAFISEILKAENISKVPDLINIVINGTETDITFDVTKQYIDDVIALRTDRITTNTIPGEGRMGRSQLGYNTSYYYIDKEKAKIMIDEMFYNKISNESGETAIQVTSSSVITNNDSAKDSIRVELLNAGTSSSVINNLVDMLKKEDFYVVKIGNYETTKKESSRIIDYGTASTTKLNELKKISKINKVENIDSESTVDFTIIVGPNYK